MNTALTLSLTVGGSATLAAIRWYADHVASHPSIRHFSFAMLVTRMTAAKIVEAAARHDRRACEAAISRLRPES